MKTTFGKSLEIQFFSWKFEFRKMLKMELSIELKIEQCKSLKMEFGKYLKWVLAIDRCLRKSSHPAKKMLNQCCKVAIPREMHFCNICISMES